MKPTKQIINLVAMVLAFSAATFLSSCNKEDGFREEVITSSSKGESSSAINNAIQQYSKVIAIALNNEEFRSVVKENALKQFDGDYDILVKDLHNLLMPNSSNSISEFLASIVDSVLYSDINTGGSNFLREAISIVPNLQISVPVNCENWATSSFVPNVVPLPVDFDDQKTDSIASYNREWEKANVSLDEDPAIPYVIISVSERIDRYGQNKYYEETCKDNNSDSSSATVTTNLLLKYGNNANELRLEWPDVNDDYGYQVYRATIGTGNELIATTPTNTNTYIDSTVNANQRYTYSIRSLNCQGQPSGYSPTVSWYGSERFPGEMLKLGALKFDNKRALRNFESWVRGKPELVLYVYSGVGIDASKRIRCIDWITPQPSRTDISERWWSCDININKWDPELDGQKWTFSWSEEDNFKDLEITLAVSGTYEDSIGNYKIGASPNVKFKITNHNDMGYLCINYWDSKTEEYNLGSGFNFKFQD